MVGWFSASMRALPKKSISPSIAMPQFVEWLDSLSGKIQFISYPALFDGHFLYWYLMQFTNVVKRPYKYFDLLCIKTYAAVVLGIPFYKVSMEKIPQEWFGEIPHDHTPLNDAVGQGYLYFNLIKVLSSRLKPCKIKEKRNEMFKMWPY